MDGTQRTEQRDDELQRIAAMAAAEVVRIIGQVPTQTDTVAAVAAMAMKKDVESIKEAVGDIKEKLDTHYVTVDQFDPVRRVVYFVMGVFGLAVIGAVVSLVVKH